MSRHPSQGLPPISDRLPKEPSNCSFWPAIAPIPDPFPPSQRHLDQHDSYQKRTVSGISTVAGTHSEDAQKRRRLLLEMDDWTGARAQKPLTIAFPRADPDAPVWGWSGETETAAAAVDENVHLRPVSRPGSASYSVKKYSPARYSFPSSSSTATAMTAGVVQPRYSLRQSPRSAIDIPVEAPRNSQNSQPVSGTLSVEEQQRFESDGVGMLSPSGLTTGFSSQGSPTVSGAMLSPVHVPEEQPDGCQELSDREESCGSSMDRERTPSEVPEDFPIGEDSDSGGHREDETKGQEETRERSDADESEPEEDADGEESQLVGESSESDLETDSEEGTPREDDSEGESIASAEGLSEASPQEPLEECDDGDVQFVPVDGQQTRQIRREHQDQEHHQRYHQERPPTADRRRAPRSRPTPKLVRDASTLSEVSRAAAAIEAQRVTIREIPNYNDGDDPIEDSESESEMMRRAKPLKATGTRGRGRGAQRPTRARTARRGRG